MLLAFSGARTPDDALSQLSKQWEVDTHSFRTVVSHMVRERFLVPATAGTFTNLSEEGFGGVLAHHQMIRDTFRVLAYQTAILRHVSGRRVVEIGCGTGLLSIMAANAGASHVTAIEETRIAHLAKAMFIANGCAGLIDLRVGNSRDVELDEPADVIIHELIGRDPYRENLLPTIEDARQRLLKPGGRLIPYRLRVFCVGFQVDDQAYVDKARVLAEAAEFPRIYGLNFDPYLAALSSMSEPLLPRALQFDESRSRVLSDECLIHDIDFRESSDAGGEVSPSVRLKIRRRGLLGAVAIFFRAHLDERTEITTSPFAPLTCWGHHVIPLCELLEVQPGSEVALKVGLETERGVQKILVGLP